MAAPARGPELRGPSLAPAAPHGSRDADHGVAALLFLLGPGIMGSRFGKHPSFDELVAGDLAYRGNDHVFARELLPHAPLVS